MKSVVGSKTMRNLEEASELIKNEPYASITLDLARRVFPEKKPTGKKIKMSGTKMEFIQFVRILQRLHMVKGGKGVLLLTWSELAFLFKGRLFTESRGDVKKAYIKHVKDHVSTLIRLGTMKALPPQYRFCIAPVPEEAFNDGWHIRLPSNGELYESYRTATRRGYLGVYISVVENGSVLIAYLNKNVNIGQRIVDNGNRVVEGAAHLISPETREIFGLTPTQLLARESEEPVATPHKRLSLPFVSMGDGNFRRLNDSLEN